jgi:YD repeat-containing protein
MPSPGLSLQFSRSYSNSIYARYANGPLGRGWSVPWQSTLASQDNAALVRIVSQDGSARSFSLDTRDLNYFSGTGDSAKLVSVGGGAFELRADNGTVTRYRSDGKIDFVVDTNNNKITAGYSDNGRLTSLTHSSGAALTIAYNAAGLIASVTDSAGRATAYGYDSANSYLTTVTTADGKVTRYTYETAGSPQSKHALLSIERGGTTQFFTYDSQGRLDASFLAGNSQFVDYGYDDAGVVTLDDDLNTNGLTSLYFDYNGQLAKSVDALGNITTNAFDANLHLRKTVGPTGESQSFTWCSCGSMTSVTNELGQTTTFAYDNVFKRMTSFTDAKGNTTRYTYDANGNLLTTVYPNGSVERLSNYTSAGLPGVSTNRRGQSLSYTYNALGQVTRQTFADNSFITFAYDARGNLTSVTDGSEITTYSYNLSVDGDRLKRVTYPNGRYLDYTYDAFGRRTQMVDQDGFATKYEYDAAGRLYRLRDSANTLLVTYTYDTAGRLSRIDKGNGTFTTYEYDAAGQILSLKNWRNATELNSKFDYTYDSRGRRVSMTTLDGSWTYGYDGSGQLIRAVFVSLNTATIPNQDLRYFYDAVGNRTKTIINGVETLYLANNLYQYTSVGGVAQTYDADGNLTFDGENTYVYDQ